MVNNHINLNQEEFEYQNKINKQETKDFIKTARIIGEIITKMNGEISDLYLEYRIRQLIYGGSLDIKGIPRSMRHYSVKLR